MGEIEERKRGSRSQENEDRRGHTRNIWNCVAWLAANSSTETASSKSLRDAWARGLVEFALEGVERENTGWWVARFEVKGEVEGGAKTVLAKLIATSECRS